MDRRLLFPAVVATAWAQQTSPAAVEAERALRARAEQFYQFAADKKYRQGEALVAEDTKDYYYNDGKPNIQTFTIDKVELLGPDNTHAKVTIKTKVTMIAPMMPGIVVDVPMVSTWKLENGEWCWYVDQSADIETPFGKFRNPNDVSGGTSSLTPGMMPGAAMPTAASLKNQVSIDRTSIVLTNEAPVQMVKISNHLPGPVTIEVQSAVEGLVAEIANKSVESQKETTISFHAKPDSKPVGKVEIDVLPMGQHFDVIVNSK